MKIMHWPGASIFLVTGLVMLAIVFLPLAVRSCCKSEANRRMKTFYILVAIVMAFNIVGALFKIMHWQGANVFLMIGIPLPFVVLLPVYLRSDTNDKEINYKNLMAVMFFFAYFAAITAMLALGVSRNVIEGFVRSGNIIMEKTAVLDENTKWLSSTIEKDTLAYRNSVQRIRRISEEADKICGKIDEIRMLMLSAGLNNTSGSITDSGLVDLQEIKYMDKRPVIEMQTITGLKTEINDFYAQLKKESPPGSAFSNYLNETFTTVGNYSDGDTWENILIRDKILASSIEKLNLIQFRVRLAAYEAIARIN
jgi:hypothetical protein